jgi:hypothetical protein
LCAARTQPSVGPAPCSPITIWFWDLPVLFSRILGFASTRIAQLSTRVPESELVGAPEVRLREREAVVPPLVPAVARDALVAARVSHRPVQHLKCVSGGSALTRRDMARGRKCTPPKATRRKAGRGGADRGGAGHPALVSRVCAVFASARVSVALCVCVSVCVCVRARARARVRVRAGLSTDLSLLVVVHDRRDAQLLLHRLELRPPHPA